MDAFTRTLQERGVTMKDGIHPIGLTVPIKKHRTNADKIRAMSDEELAGWISNLYILEDEHAISIYDTRKKSEIYIPDSYGDVLEWLQSEA